MKNQLVIFILGTLLFSCAAEDKKKINESGINTSKPYTYWWWQGNAVDTANIAYNLEMMNWAGQNNVTFRNQTHGSPTNWLDVYAIADIPETESFGSSPFKIPGFDRDSNYISIQNVPNSDVYKFASSAAHVSGKLLVACETHTWLREHFSMREAVSNDYIGSFENTNDTLENAFVNPPAHTRPGVFWQWNGGMISKEGLTKDLEAMSEQGVGGVMVMQMPSQAPYPQRWDFRDYPGKVKVLSDEWFNLVNHAIGEADRLGIAFSMFISPGWSHAGGPWITSRRGLKKLVYTKTEVDGSSKLNILLQKAPKTT